MKTLRNRYPFFFLATLGTILAVALAPSAQSLEPRQIDELGKWNSEDLSARLDNAAIQIQTQPNSSLQILLSRSKKQPPGRAYGDLGMMRAYFAARKSLDPNRIIPTLCKPQDGQNVQLWLIPSGGVIKQCEPDQLQIDKTSLFDTTNYPNYPLGGCCLIDDLDIPASEASIAAFANQLKKMPDVKGYIFIYGGTNIYWSSISGGSERAVRHIDTNRQIKGISFATLGILKQNDLPRSQFILRETGYRDSYAQIEMWIVPQGGMAPIPTPNYIKKRGVKHI